MARGFIRVLRGYEFVEKNPVIDKLRTLAQKRGLFNKLGIIEELSSVKRATLKGWWHGETKRPQHHTAMAVVHALGFREEFVEEDGFDVEAERKKAATWRSKQPTPPKVKPKPRKPRKKRSN
jgi:hypothetical protein